MSAFILVFGVLFQPAAPGIWTDGGEIECPDLEAFQDVLDADIDADPMSESEAPVLRLGAGCLSLSAGVWLPVSSYRLMRVQRADLRARVTARAGEIESEARADLESARMWGWILSAAGIVVGFVAGLCGDGDCSF